MPCRGRRDFGAHRPVKLTVKRSRSTELLQRVVGRTAEVATKRARDSSMVSPCRLFAVSDEQNRFSHLAKRSCGGQIHSARVATSEGPMATFAR